MNGSYRVNAKCSSCGRYVKGLLEHRDGSLLCVQCTARPGDTIAARTTVELLPPGPLTRAALEAAVADLEHKLVELDHSELPRRADVIHVQGRLIAAYRALVLELRTSGGQR